MVIQISETHVYIFVIIGVFAGIKKIILQLLYFANIVVENAYMFIPPAPINFLFLFNIPRNVTFELFNILDSELLNKPVNVTSQFIVVFSEWFEVLYDFEHIFVIV